MTQSTETDVSWDLGDLFAGPDDPAIDAALLAAKERAESFAAQYQGKIDSPDLTAARLASAIREYEALWQDAGKPGTYARLRFSADTSDPARGALMSRVQEQTTKLSLPLVFYRLELARGSRCSNPAAAGRSPISALSLLHSPGSGRQAASAVRD